MITTTDWNDALDAWVDEECERLGGPPTPEEVVAYLNGELAGAAAARIRALLVYYPDLTPLLHERIETPHAARGTGMRLYAAAAMIAIATLTLLLIREHRQNARPSVISSRHELSTLRTRSVDVIAEWPAGKESYLITAVPSEPPTSGAYQLRIIRGSDVLWSENGVRPTDDTFDIRLPGRFLKPGTYALEIHASDGPPPRLVDTFTFRITPSQ